VTLAAVVSSGTGSAGAIVLVATHRLEPSRAADVGSACRRAGAEPVEWQPSAGDPPGVPALVIAGLRPGERRIPPDLVTLATQTRPGLRLLLLCAEPLIRPTLTLQGGQITLLGPPFTAERVYSRVRVLLADGEREHLRDHWWLAPLGASVSQSHATGMTAVLAEGGVKPIDESEATRLVEILRNDEPEKQREKTLTKALGGAGLVHLSPGAQQWTFFWPAKDGLLWLSSPLRLPGWYDVSQAMRKASSRLFSMPASGGDVVTALAGTLPSPLKKMAVGLLEPELAGALADGGPAILDQLDRHLRDSGKTYSGMIAEVR
jgi:hypothetical protein